MQRGEEKKTVFPNRERSVNTIEKKLKSHELALFCFCL
jgi:hypothetical protein